MPELRRDPIGDRWVIVGDDPTPLARALTAPVRTTAPPATAATPQLCPLCPGQEALAPHELWVSRRAADGRWQTRVVAHRAPLLGVEGQLERHARGPYDWMSGIGAHEVIVETPRHEGDLPDLSAAEIETILTAYRERIIDLKRDIRFEYLHIFRNHGDASGARTTHPCSQLLALPFVPPEIAVEVASCRRHFERTRRCQICDVLDYELEGRGRIIVEQRDIIAFCPYASRSPFEVWVLPRQHRASFEHTPHVEIAQFAAVLREVTARLRLALDDSPYYFALHNSPVALGDAPHYHWHLELHPLIHPSAGLGNGIGTVLNPVAPELAARHLRDLRWTP